MMRSVRVYRAFRSGACFGPRSERGDRRQIDVRRNLEEIRTAGRRAASAHTVPPAGARYSFRGNVGTSGTTTNTVTEHAVSEIRRRFRLRCPLLRRRGPRRRASRRLRRHGDLRLGPRRAPRRLARCARRVRTRPKPTHLGSARCPAAAENQAEWPHPERPCG